MFITFEGIEGVGKTTQLKFLGEQLTKANVPILITREPGGTPIGEEIRDILLAHRYERVAPMTELLLMFSARAQHVETVIQPALKQGRWVLCDRFIDATYAYQGGGRGVSMDLIAGLESLVLGDFAPNYTLIFDAPAEIGLARVQGRSMQDRFEKEKIEFFERVRAAYQVRAQNDLNRYKIIDATEPLEKVKEKVLKIINDLMAQYDLH